MAIQKAQTMLGVRVPVGLRESLMKYCLGHGVKMSYFVAQAIQERLGEMTEDQEDVRTAKERLSRAEYVGQDEMGKYLRKRGSKS